MEGEGIASLRHPTQRIVFPDVGGRDNEGQVIHITVTGYTLTRGIPGVTEVNCVY